LVPAAFSAGQLADHDNHYLNVMARLKPGTSQAQAQSELNVIAQWLQKQYPIDDQDRGFRLQPLATALLGDQRLGLRMMLAAVGFLLLIACANIANLQLARSRTRQKEIAMRAALGASPDRIVRQLLAENVVLGLAGGVVGVLLAYWAVAWIIAHGPAEMPRLDQSRIDASTLAFAWAVALLSSLLFGLAPALRSASTHLSEVFKSSSGISGGSRDRVRSLLVVGEVSLALILMAGAGLLIRSALLVSHLDPGFDTSNVVVGRIGLPDPGYHDPALARQTFERMITATSALPGVKSVAVVSRAPLAGGGQQQWLARGRKAVRHGESRQFAIANHLAQLSLDGPRASESRPRLHSPRCARPHSRHYRQRNSCPHHVAPAKTQSGSALLVVKPDRKAAWTPSGTRSSAWWQMFVPGDSTARFNRSFTFPLRKCRLAPGIGSDAPMDLVVRTRSSAVPIPRVAKHSSPRRRRADLPALDHAAENLQHPRTLALRHLPTGHICQHCASAFLNRNLRSPVVHGGAAHSRHWYSYGRRRIASTDCWDVLGFGLRLAGIGLAVGLAAALAATRLLSSLLYGVRPTDAVTFAAVSFILLVVALIASYLPARRATRVDPLVALRYE